MGTPLVTYDITTRSVHIHYWTDDAEMDAQGFGVTDLVCHGCGQATRFLYPAITEEQAEAGVMRPQREAFAHDHRHCVAPGHTVLCPAYEITETRDLRTGSRS